MSLANEILFEPVQRPPLFLAAHQPVFDAILQALSGLQNYEFSIDLDTQIGVYDRIVDLIEQDPAQIAYLKAMGSSKPAPDRPSNALSIRDVFRRIQAGETKFFHCGKSVLSGSRVGEFEFANVFGIHSQHPFVELKTGRRPSNCFEWWAASLHGTYKGHNAHYSFGTEDEARKYFHSP